MDQATGILAQAGIFGAFFIFVTVPLAIFSYRVYCQLQKVQEKRTEENKAVTSKLLEFSTEANKAINAVSSAVDENNRVVEGLDGAVKDLTLEVREALRELRRRDR